MKACFRGSLGHDPVCRLFVAAIFLLSGCGKKEQTGLRLMVWDQGAGHGTIEKRLEEFSRQNRRIKVELIVCPTREECGRRFLASVKKNDPPDPDRKNASAPPDICLVAGDDLPRLIQAGYVRDLQPFHPDLESFLPQTLDAVSSGKGLYAMPCGWSALMLYYNRAIFERHGIPPPRASWDWGDLLHIAQTLTVVDEESGKIIQYGLELSPSIETWGPFVWQNRGQLIREDGIWTLTDPQFLQSNQQAILFYADLLRERHLAPPAERTKKSRASERPFIKREAAMTFGQRDLGIQLEKERGFEWDIVPMPRSREAASWLEVYGYAISTKTQRLENAWKLVSFLTGETSQAAMILHGFYAPSWQSLLVSKIFTDFPGPRAVSNLALTESISCAKSAPRISYWNQSSEVLTEEMDRLMADPKASPRDALERMQTRLDELSLLSNHQPQRDR